MIVLEAPSYSNMGKFEHHVNVSLCVLFGPHYIKG